MKFPNLLTVLVGKSSLPSRECGLKSVTGSIFLEPYLVTPFAGVWIEMTSHKMIASLDIVTPFAGVWIEINIFL